MSAERLREAAALMRSRSEKASAAPWTTGPCCDNDGYVDAVNAEHIASWHPAMALEVAAFLDFAAAYGDQPEPQSPTVQFALSISNAYLGAQS